MQGLSRQRNPWLALVGFVLAALVLLAVARSTGDSASAATAKAAADVRIATKTFFLKHADQKKRLTVHCPGGRWPMGGGMKARPLPGADGEGVYPHSYERLGVQGGWHTTAVLYDPSHRSTRTRKVKLQVACGRRMGKVTPPHSTAYVNPGQTKTVIARCPGRRHLFSGGFQRTDFVSRGGNFVTESRAISPKAWQVVAHAFGRFGGEITAIAYCVRSRKPLLQEVSASTTIRGHSHGEVRTARCPGGRRLTLGGFSTHGSTSAFFNDGWIRGDESWSASGFNRSGSPMTLTAYGYCLKL